MFDFFRRRKRRIDDFETNTSERCIDLEPIETFMNSSEDKCGELYCKNGCFTYIIMEKLIEDYNGSEYHYWSPAQTTASFFDTREKAIDSIMSIIEEKEQ